VITLRGLIIDVEVIAGEAVSRADDDGAGRRRNRQVGAVVVDIIEVVAGDQSGTAGGDADASAVVVDVIINDRSVAAIGIDADQVAVDRCVIVDDCGAGVGAVQQDAGPAGGRDVRVAGDGRGDVHETCGGVEVDADLIGGDVQAA